MAKLSVIIPSRDERFLTPTIDDIFAHAEGEIEVVAVLDSEKWPGDWKQVSDRHSNLHTIHNGTPRGMRYSINAGVASAVSRGAKYVMKLDGHCSLSQGFDEVLKADCDKDWVVIPRRGRLDPENWIASDTHKPDIDYHYLSFPNDPDDFGGPGLNGKPWSERAIERIEYLIDDEMSSQGSGWFMSIDHFYRLELMDQSSYGPFWNEMQEIGLKTWLSGGALKVNKRCRYLHLHKGSKYGRGYRLPGSWLQQGATFTKNWIWNDAWAKQTKPFKWLIEHFWPVPTWPENWEEVLYASRKPRMVPFGDTMGSIRESDSSVGSGLQLHSASYGVGGTDDVDVLVRLRSLVRNNSLDIIVNNSTLTPGDNPFRGKKKRLALVYSINGGQKSFVQKDEKDWLIIGPVGQEAKEFKAALDAGYGSASLLADKSEVGRQLVRAGVSAYLDSLNDDYKANPVMMSDPPRTAPALNDYLIRRFQISPQRLRGPMPIELRDFHRNDLAQLFAELGFKRGAEIGVAEGNYSEILLKANPECELLLVDPWHAYSENPQNKTPDKHKYAYEETLRKIAPYRGASTAMKTSMEAVREIADKLPEHLLDFVYIDGNHLFDYVMQDLIEWSKRVRSGGIVSGDDYYALDQKRWVGGGVVEAVQAYTNAHRIGLWFLFEGHKSVDFMWVKP